MCVYVCGVVIDLPCTSADPADPLTRVVGLARLTPLVPFASR